jgi:hypothetical protein
MTAPFSTSLRTRTARREVTTGEDYDKGDADVENDKGRNNKDYDEGRRRSVP